MEVFAPEYYQSFRCIAGACPDSCCKEWAVDVDPEAAAYYRSLPGALGDRLRAVLEDTDNGTVMVIEDGRCPMWRQDGLCRIHAELGHDALCQTCRDFPRLRHDYGSFAELGLELSCPAAANLILTCEDTIFCTCAGETDEYDPEVMAILLKGRSDVLSFLDTTSLSDPQAFAAILLYAHNLQGMIDGGEAVLFEPSQCLADAEKYAGTKDLDALVDFFKELEILTPDWREQLKSDKQTPIYSRKLLRYFIRRYWLQAVSDFDLVCRVKFSLAACILIGCLRGDFIRNAQLFSKEIENDPDNVEAILDGCYRSPALTDSNLLALLLR